MKLTTDYREQAIGPLSGSKQYYLVCHVEFSAEERAVVDERGMYDVFLRVPAATPPPTRAGDFTAGLMRKVGILLAPVGLVTSCTTSMASGGTSAGGTIGMLIFIAGVGLFAVGKFKHFAADKREANPEQTLTLRRLMSNPEFEIHAFTIEEARRFENDVRESLGEMAQVLRQSAVVPERNTYEL